MECLRCLIITSLVDPAFLHVFTISAPIYNRAFTTSPGGRRHHPTWRPTFTHDLPFWQKLSHFVTSTRRRHLRPISARNHASYTHIGKMFVTLISFTCDTWVYTQIHTHITLGRTIEQDHLSLSRSALITLERGCLSVCRRWDFGFVVKPQRRRRWRRN